MPCEFGESLDEALCDRLVCGLRNEAYQKRLLSECELTLEKILQTAQSLETAEVNVRALRGSESEIHQNPTSMVAHTTLLHVVDLPVLLSEVAEEGTPSKIVSFLKACQ